MTEEENLIEQLKKQPIEKYFFIVNENPVAVMLKSLNYSAIIIDEKHLSISKFETIISELQPGTTYILDYIFLTCLTKRENEEVQNFLKDEGLHYDDQAWTIFCNKSYLKNPNNIEELKKSIEEFDGRGELVYNPKLAQFHHFKKNEPVAVFDFKIFEYIKENYHIFICGSPYLYIGGVYIRDNGGTKIKKIIRDCLYEQFKKSRIINQVYNLIYEADEFQLDFSEINKHPKSYVNFLDCMLDVKTMQNIPHDPKYFSINQVPFRYEDIEKTSKGEKIEKFLNSMVSDTDDRKMFLEFSGLAKTTDTSFQKFLVLLGAAGNGKSILIRLIEASTGKMNTSNVAMQNLEKRFATSNLVGKTLNACADLSEDAMEDCSTIKQVVGEDTLMAERKGENAFSFKSYTKLVFSTNMLPIVKNEKTAGFYRRMLILKIDKPTIDDSDIDINFFEKLEDEILYFCKISINALHEAYQRGAITISENSKKAVNQLRKDSDVVQAWIDDCCITREDLQMERTGAFEEFKEYCKNEERQSLTRNGFFKALRTKNYTEAKIKGYYYFKGLNLSKNCPPNTEKTAPNEFMQVSKEDLEELPFIQ